MAASASRALRLASDSARAIVSAAHVKFGSPALARWLAGVSWLIVVEFGVGRAIPSVRMMSERNGPRIIRAIRVSTQSRRSDGSASQGAATDRVPTAVRQDVAAATKASGFVFSGARSSMVMYT